MWHLYVFHVFADNYPGSMQNRVESRTAWYPSKELASTPCLASRIEALAPRNPLVKTLDLQIKGKQEDRSRHAISWEECPGPQRG